MTTFGINIFESVRDGVRQRTEDLEWDEFADFMLGQRHVVSPTKDGVRLFNATRFKSIDEVLSEDRGGYREEPDGTQVVRRQQRNALAVELLILDYDGTLTLEDARARFSEHEYLGYTSYGHLKKPGVHKFRLIFPLTRPIPAFKKFNEYEMLIEQGVFYDLSEALIEFAPGCDPVVTKAVQAYYLPSAPADRIKDAQIWRNRGSVLDWTAWKRNDAYAAVAEVSAVPRRANGLPNRSLDPDQEFACRRGVIKPADVRGRVQHVRCPFHDDAKGSEFLVRYETGVVCFHCKRCGSFSLRPADRLPPSVVKEAVATEAKLAALGFELEGDWWDHTDRQRVGRFLADAKKKILADRGQQQRVGVPHFKSHVLYLPEGAGKSQLALSFLSDPPFAYFPHAPTLLFRHQIVFACKSWKQVIEKEAAFRPKVKELGRTSRVAWSFDGSIERRFNVKVRRSGGRPFAPGQALSEETIGEIRRKNPRLSESLIRLTWEILKGDPDRFARIAVPDRVSTEPVNLQDDEDLIFDDLGPEPPAIIFTTFAQLRLIAVRHDRIPLNWIIWIDDPDLDELLDIKPASRASGADRSADPDEAKEREIDGTRYHVRPELLSLGLPFINHRCIYTTTERVTLRLLKHHLDKHRDPYEVHGERHRVTGGRITILGTNRVQKKFDAIVPLLVRRLELEHGRKVTLIADGIPAEFNHSTNKGRDDLKKRDLLVEVSHAHPSQVKTVCDALGLRFTEHSRQIGLDLMVDKLHQAIGRNSGFRSEGFECVVLVDKSHHAALVAECGYAIDTDNSVVIDLTAKMVRTDTRLTDSASPLVKQIARFLNLPTDYLTDLRKVKPDVEFVLAGIEDGPKRLAYTVRLLVALTSLTQVRFDRDADTPPSSHFGQKVQELGQWILTARSDQDREAILTGYSMELQDRQVPTS